MRPSLDLLSRTILLSSTVMLVVACSDSNSNDGVDGAVTGGDAMHNPPNPAGLGPAPVDVGSTTVKVRPTVPWSTRCRSLSIASLRSSTATWA